MTVTVLACVGCQGFGGEKPPMEPVLVEAPASRRVQAMGKGMTGEDTGYKF